MVVKNDADVVVEYRGKDDWEGDGGRQAVVRGGERVAQNRSWRRHRTEK